MLSCRTAYSSIPGISKRVGIKVRRYDFSDPQSGKDICDRRIAVMKSHMRLYLNEGSDINSSSDMKRALDSYGGVKSCRVAAVNVDVSKQVMTDHKWKGIQSLNNFEFLSTGIRVWKAFGVGKAKLFKNKVLKDMASHQPSTGLCILEPFSDPKEDKGVFKRIRKENRLTKKAAENFDDTLPNDVSTTRGFNCPDVNCIKVFVSNSALDRHLDSGKHMYRAHHESSVDPIKRKWVHTCTSVGTGENGAKDLENSTVKERNRAANACAEMGLALKKSKSRGRYSEHLKEYLKKLFLEGEETGRKANPSDVSSAIKSLKTEDGKSKLFERSEWLTAQQVKSYFLRLSVLNRCGKLGACNTDDEDIDMVEEALVRQERVNDIHYAIEL